MEILRHVTGVRMSEVVYPGRAFFGDRFDEVYYVVSCMAPGLCLDIGAAAGRGTFKLAKGSPASRVIAFEPFVGNHTFFHNTTKYFANVELVPKAVSDFVGVGRLFVHSTLKGTEKYWEGYEGYSSNGMLIPVSDPRFHDSKASDISVCTVHSAVDERVRFMKIDVQGAEAAVIEGAQRTIKEHGIDVIYVEFEGEQPIIDVLLRNDYVLIDSGHYVYSQKKPGWPPERVSSALEPSTVSSGRAVHKGWIIDRPLPLTDYLDWIRSPGQFSLYTDICAVHRDVFPEFMTAAARRMSSIRDTEPAMSKAAASDGVALQGDGRPAT
jgi:FkbM family methyltransferase